MAVGTEESLSGNTEAFAMHLMADAVTGSAEDYTVLGGYRLEIAVVICVFEPVLQHVVIDVADRPFGTNGIDAHFFEL